MSQPFWTKQNANHYVYQALLHGKLKLKEQWTNWDKYCFKFTLLAQRHYFLNTLCGSLLNDLHLKNTASSSTIYFWNCQSILLKLGPQTPVINTLQPWKLPSGHSWINTLLLDTCTSMYGIIQGVCGLASRWQIRSKNPWVIYFLEFHTWAKWPMA